MDISTWSIAIGLVAATAFTPLMMHALARRFPAQRGDWLEYQSLRARFRSVEAAAQLIAIVTVVAVAWLLIAFHRVHTLWSLGVLIGWSVLSPILLIALLTLRRGTERWREFWRFYEVSSRISIRFITPICIALCVLGIISTAVLLFTQ